MHMHEMIVFARVNCERTVERTVSELARTRKTSLSVKAVVTHTHKFFHSIVGVVMWLHILAVETHCRRSESLGAPKQVMGQKYVFL